MNLILAYKTNSAHSHLHRDLIGISETREGIMELIDEQCTKEGRSLPADQVWNLNNLNQTQGLWHHESAQFEIDLEEVETEVLI